MLAGEMQWAMQQMFRQYDAVADLLVPSEQMPEFEPQTEPAVKPARSKQPMLNLGDLQDRFAWRVMLRSVAWFLLALGYGICIGHYWAR
jgi:hypothetical protein